MLCKICKGDSVVKDSRDAGPFKVKRRRLCLNCGHRWSTEEKEKPGKMPQANGAAAHARNRLLGPVYIG